MKKIRFCTLYPRGSAVEFYKDVGQIPYTLAKMGKAEATMICCYATKEEADLKKMPELHYEQKKMLCGNQTLTGLLYLLTHARKIDWLNVYHGGRHCYYWIKLYKLLNPKGKVYLKLDLSYAGCEMYQNSEKERNIFEKTAAVSDIVSVESKKIKKLTAEFTKQNIRVVPNGYINEAETIPQVNREKQFITVGRLGTPEKATDILLEAFAQSANSHDWTLKLVGSVAQDFQTWLEDFYNRYPEIKERIIFTGPIYEREALYREYRKARVFVLPSRWEAFPLVGPEALYNGCRMILSDTIPPIEELTGNLAYGEVVKAADVESLKEALIRETERNTAEQEAEEIATYAREHLSWYSICENLLTEMEGEI